MKILFLAPYPAYESPSQRYRFEHYLESLQEQGIAYSYKPFLSKWAWTFFFQPGHYLKKIIAVSTGYLRRWGLMFTIGRYDFVYVHREAAPVGPPVFEWIISKLYRKKMIFDFDDAIWVPVVSQSNRVARLIKWPSKVASICNMSYRVSAGNHFLADFARKYCRNVIVVPTVVDTEKTHNKLQQQEIDNPVVGWTGTFSTLKYLDVVLPAIKSLQEKYNFPFVVIANKDPELSLKNYRFIQWQKETEIEDLLSMHIGLMPLTDGDIEKGKCGFKAIQYLSLGIPAVVSPVGVNTDIVKDGINGYVASSVDEWTKAIEKLYNDRSLRKQFGEAGRKKIVTDYSINSSFHVFLSLFS
jgi:glycosyltransferase involved in cell wall biosynthesis